MNFTINEIIERRVCLKFCVANELLCVNVLTMLGKTYGDSVLSKTRAYEWYKVLQEGRKIFEDIPRSGRPSTSTIELNVYAIKEMVLENRHISLREVAHCLNISHESDSLSIWTRDGSL